MTNCYCAQLNTCKNYKPFPTDAEGNSLKGCSNYQEKLPKVTKAEVAARYYTYVDKVCSPCLCVREEYHLGYVKCGGVECGSRKCMQIFVDTINKERGYDV